MKAIQLACCLAGFSPCLRAAETIVPGAIGYWKFDETKGEAVRDSSTNGNHGSLRGAIRGEGKSSGGVQCGNGMIVEVPHTASQDNIKQGITLAAWVKREADGAYNMIISREITDGPGEYFGLAIVKNKALFSLNPQGNQSHKISSDEELPVGEWIYLAGVYDKLTFKLYVNGRMVKSGNCSAAFRFEDDNPIIIGGNTNTKGKVWVGCFHGVIDEVRLLNHPLGDQEVFAIYHADPEKP